jgi:hypothetical protein
MLTYASVCYGQLARLLADQVALRELATRGRVLAQVLDFLALLVQKYKY